MNKKKDLKHKSTAGKKPAPGQVKKNGIADWLGLSLIILLGIIIYSNSFDCSFHFDDKHTIVDNVKIRNISDVNAWSSSYSSRPLSVLTFVLNYHFNQLDVWYYHLVNLIIHLLNACLVWWLTLLILSSPNLKNYPVVKHKKNIALVIALLFISHPLATQSVTYIVQRMASMASLFYFLSLALYLKARLSEKSKKTKYLLFAGSLVSAVIAMLSKENAFTLPVAAVLLEIFFVREIKFSAIVKDYRTLLVIAAGACFLLILIFKFSFSIFNPLPPDYTNEYRTITPLNYLFTQFSVIVTYIRLLIVPVNQNLDYDFPLSNNFFEMGTMLSFLLLLSLLSLAIFLFRKNRLISFGIIWFFLTLSVESSIIPISDLIFEHRTYLPSYGFFLVLGCGIFALPWNKYRYVAVAVFAIIIVTNSILTYERNKVWKNELSLWNDVILKSPGKARCYVNRAGVFMESKNYDAALRDFDTAIKLNPNFENAFYGRGAVFFNRDKNEEAIVNYSKAIELKPDFAEAYYTRANSLRKLKRTHEALTDYNKALELKPSYYMAYFNKACVLMDEKRNEEALINFNKVIELEPGYANAYVNRGNLYKDAKKIEEAIHDYSRAIELKADFAAAYFNRAWAHYDSGRKDAACEDIRQAGNLGLQITADELKLICNQ